SNSSQVSRLLAEGSSAITTANFQPVVDDSLTPSLTEALAVLNPASPTETLTPSLSESLSLLAVLSRTDSLSPGAADALSQEEPLLSVTSGSDSLPPSITE